MASYFGNIILPTCAGLALCMGIYQLAHKAKSGERSMTAAVACLSASGFVRLVESFSTQQTGQDQFWYALLGLTNWVANVIMPLYCAINLIRAVLSVSKQGFELTTVGGNTQRHVIVAVACLGVSMALRLCEWFVTTGQGGIH
jgi:TRAP-type C4-dicarboxylate transport system permease small subunit